MMCDMENKYEWMNERTNERMNGAALHVLSRVDYKYKEVENILLVFSLTFLFRRRPKCTDICMSSVVLKWNLNKNHSLFFVSTD